MKIESVSSVNSVSGNTAMARRPAENPVETSIVKGQQVQEDNSQQITQGKVKTDEALKVANEAFKDVNVGFKYSIDKKTNLQIVEIYNTATNEKIWQSPPEEIVNMLSRIIDMLGALVDKKI